MPQIIGHFVRGETDFERFYLFLADERAAFWMTLLEGSPDDGD